MTGDGLTAFNQVSGLAGTQPVPDLATSLPAPTDGGRTYTFQLRPGIRYSNGRPVQATDFRSTFERFFALGSPATDYDGIVGGAQCRKHPKRCDLSRGIVADDRAHTVTFHLTRPDPNFLYKLAFPSAYVLPGGTPRRPAGTHPLPATGPYMIATYRPRRLLRFVRNPFFHEWSRAAQPDGYPDRIDIRIAGTADEAIRDVVDGKADVVRLAQPWTPSQLSRLELQHASQIHSDPRWNLQALFLNTRVPPFDRLDARRAINLAVDRAAATSAWGGPNVAEPTCQLLPPNFPSYRPYCPYTAGSTKSGTWTAPDLAKAKALVARSGTRGMKVTVWAWSQAKGFNQVAVKVLRSLGYRVAVKPVVGDRYWGVVGDSRNRAQIGFDGWALGYPDPASFLSALQLCSVPAREPRQPERDRVLRPGHRPPDAEGAGRAAERPDRVARTLATGRPRAHRRCTVGAAHGDEGRELPLEARRQLPIQPGDGHADRPALGTVGQQGRDGVAAGRTLCRVDSTRSGRSVRWDTLGPRSPWTFTSTSRLCAAIYVPRCRARHATDDALAITRP